MELPFWRERLAERFGVSLAVPAAEDRVLVHRVIYEELVRGRIEPRSRADYADVIHHLASAGAEAVVLGCTEITLLIGTGDSPLPVFDTTALHAEAAVAFSMDAPTQRAAELGELPSASARPREPGGSTPRAEARA